MISVIINELKEQNVVLAVTSVFKYKILNTTVIVNANI